MVWAVHVYVKILIAVTIPFSIITKVIIENGVHLIKRHEFAIITSAVLQMTTSRFVNVKEEKICTFTLEATEFDSKLVYGKKNYVAEFCSTILDEVSSLFKLPHNRLAICLHLSQYIFCKRLVFSKNHAPL